MNRVNLSYPQVPETVNSICCIGNFDGVHIGHQKLISRTVELARQKDAEAAVITFWPDPNQFLKPKTDRRYITTEENKFLLFEQYGIDTVYILEFDEQLSALSADSFIEYMNSFSVDTLICGFDFTYGYRGNGTADTLISCELRNFDVEVIECQQIDNEKISSRKILRLIREGNIADAVRLLGHDYLVEGEVINGIFESEVNQMPCDGEYQVEILDRLQTVRISDRKFDAHQYSDGLLKVKFPFMVKTIL